MGDGHGVPAEDPVLRLRDCEHRTHSMGHSRPGQGGRRPETEVHPLLLSQAEMKQRHKLMEERPTGLVFQEQVSVP